jgi:hypothetical protein
MNTINHRSGQQELEAVLVTLKNLWHIAWMSGTARHIERPTEGTYTIRLVRRGPLVPVKIERTEGRWLATIDGKPLSYAYTDQEVEAAVMVALLDGRLSTHPFVKLLAHAGTIDEAEYNRMLDLRVWAAEHAPWHPCLHPHQPIDLTKLPSLW